MDTSENESSGLRLILIGLVAAAAILLGGVLYWAIDPVELSGSSDEPVISASAEPETAPPPLASSPARETGPSTLSPVPSLDGRAGDRQPRTESADPTSSNFSQSQEETNLAEVDVEVRKEMRALADSKKSQSQKVASFKSYLAGDHDAATQSLAVKHLSKLVSDDQYNQYLASELLNPEQSEPVRSALIQDINARGREVMMRVMLEAAADPEHPLKDYAHQTLGRYLGDNYSEDPDMLRVLVDEYINRSNDGL